MDAKLPYKQVVIKYKDLSRDPRYKGLYGKLKFNQTINKYEIVIDKRLNPDLLELTKNHELVHARRQHKYYIKKKEENETELEAIARTPKTCLTQAEGIVHDFMLFNRRNPKKPLNPNNPKHLKIILKRIKKIVVK